jgi:superfamily II DNA or RNA helicase
MSLDAAAFEGFDAHAALVGLQGFDEGARVRGKAYYNQGHVSQFACSKPGISFVAVVQGTYPYEVNLAFDRKTKRWRNDCTCPLESGCKHAYAALQQLIVEHAGADVRALSSGKATRSAKAKPAVPPPPPGFGAMVVQKLGRPLDRNETNYLRAINSAFQAARASKALFARDLQPFGLPPAGSWWDRLDLWASVPQNEADFWNHVANYLEEQGVGIPEFLQPVTELGKVRERLRLHRRAREIEQWVQHLDQLDHATPDTGSTALVELRLRLLPKEAHVEWRPPGGEWTELKSKKFRDFEIRHAAGLSPEAALLWQPLIQRVESYYGEGLRYLEPWAVRVLGRWLRQPVMRPLFVNETGAPLVFHEEPLRWDIGEPGDADGDYTVRLVRPDGQPAPMAQAVFDGRPALYLTSEGVFTGPPQEYALLDPLQANRIPARAFETPGGLRLIERLHAKPPPRLAARIRVVPLQPRVTAEITQPWAGSQTEYCHVDVLGFSDDGRNVERWNGEEWILANDLAPRKLKSANALERMERAALGPLPTLIGDAGFKWDFNAQRWMLRLTKKFPEVFVPFLQSLPPEVTIELRGELAAFQNAQVAGRIRLEATEAGQDWFDLRVLVDVNDTTLTPEEIKLLLDAKGKWVRLGAKGWKKMEFKLSEEEDRELARLGLTPHELTSEPQRMHALQLADKAARKFLPAETCNRIERRVTELQARVTPDVPVGIKAELRPYQRDGFHFLAYLSTNNFGGILADDMGLGKTVQTLAWIEWLRTPVAAGILPAVEPGFQPGGKDAASANSAINFTAPSPANAIPGGKMPPSTAGKMPAATLPSLVVCPKSVADNWHAEAARFLPGLRVKAWPAGELKHLAKRLGDADLHVINYSQLRSVGQELAAAKFLAVILDEGQYIKNPSSLTGQMARKLRAEHRLILSGTPIENRLLDLWSLMSFAMPGALGSRAEFGRLYDAKGDPFARQRLSARVRPFLIRRTKAQVARDLPDRIEEDLFCELEGEQKTLYRAELKRAQAMLLGVKTAAALNKQRFNFLTSLLRLRQICCHPKLVKADSKAASAKLEALVETLEPLMEEGQKVLVFSQFVEMLDLIRAELKKRKWKHWYLAGDTENRGDLVREFQSAEHGGVFLISLKAGGFGLNLTASSYVILFDPWWNPAVENQAIDRTHRIGQTQKVIAYRLLIKDSIEEKIRALQRQKKGLAEDVLGEEKFSQSLSLDDLRYLLTE